MPSRTRPGWHATQRVSSARLAALAAGLALLITASPAASTPAQEPLPSDQEILEHFQDQFGRTTFAATGVTGWRPVETWRRVAQLVFPPGTNERTDPPERPDPATLRQIRFRLFQRSIQGHDEFNLIEEIADPQGNPLFTNPFPRFRGDPDRFVFSINRTDSQLPEFEYHCRTLTSRDGHFLVCRNVRGSDGNITFMILVDDATGPATVDPGALPTDPEILKLFADQLGRRSFTPSGVTAWTQTEVWRRVDSFQFPPGADETTGVKATHEVPPLDKLLRLFQRTNQGRAEFGLVEELTTAPERTNRFPVARGTPESWVFYNHATELGEFEETCRRVPTGAAEVLACRTIRPDQGFHYQTFVKEDPDLP